MIVDKKKWDMFVGKAEAMLLAAGYIRTDTSTHGDTIEYTKDDTTIELNTWELMTSGRTGCHLDKYAKGDGYKKHSKGAVYKLSIAGGGVNDTGWRYESKGTTRQLSHLKNYLANGGSSFQKFGRVEYNPEHRLG